ncbi:MAG TPA: cellulase family glycosylhydrolase [Candidatus Saccharimonadales bacterium]|nr:cellulase family glycosylhydrolase [Candidatus Saccharimonadales bacterium]
MDPHNGVYDKDDRKPVTKPDLLSQEKAAQPEQQSGGLYNPDGDKPSESKTVDPQSLGTAEAGLPGEKLGKGFTNKTTRPGLADRFQKFMRSPANRRRGLIIGGTGGGLATIAVIGFLLLAPLKIETIVNQIHTKMYATTTDAVDKETQSLLTHYIVDHVLPSYKSCGSTVSRHCSVGNIVGSDPVSNLFRSWSQARLEEKLASPPYNIEFKYDSRLNTWHIITPSTGKEGEDIGSEGEKLDSVLASRADVRQAVKDAVAGETFYKQMFLRYKVDRLLSEKYGIRWCTIFCGISDPLQNKIADQKIAAKLFVIEKVVRPRDAALGVAMTCLFTQNCKSTDTQPTPCEEGVSCEGDGAPENPQVDTALREQLTQLAGEESGLTADQLEATFKEVEKYGWQTYLVRQTVGKMVAVAGGDEAAQIAAKDVTANALPVIGWINFVAQIANKARHFGPDIRKLAYLTNLTAAISLWSTYQSYADEIHTGHATATEVGSFTNSLGPGGSSTAKDPELGGTADATQTPLYQSVINDNSNFSTPPSPTVSVLNSLLPSAYADSLSSSSPAYRCNDGSSVTPGHLVCPEENLAGGNGIANSISSTLSSPPFGIMLDVWNGSIGAVYGAISSLAGFIINPLVSAATTTLNATCDVPILNSLSPAAPYCTVRNEIKTVAPKIMTAAVNQVVPNPISDNMSGGRTVDMMIAGADGANSEAAHYNLGGQVLSPGQSAQIVAEQDTEAKQSFSSQPLFARLFGSSPYSMVSKIALAMPYSLQSTEASLASIISDPLSTLGGSFSSLFAGHAHAATQPTPDPFGITQYGYPEGTIPSDPQQYWNQYCTDNPSQAYQKTNQWNTDSASNIDPTTGMPDNTSTNPCLLIKTTTGVDGGAFDSSLLTPDDLAGANATTASAAAPPKSGFSTQGKKILLNGNQFTPYGISVVDDLEGSNWCTQHAQNVSDAEIHAAAQYWHVNSIRLQVSEDNFMNGATCTYAGKTYTSQDAMNRLGAEVDEIENLSKIPIINDDTEKTGGPLAPTENSVIFWDNFTAYLAGKSNTEYNNVIFDLFNEPSTEDNIWAFGGNYQGTTYLGMQDLVNAIRNGPNLNNNLVFVEGESIPGLLHATSLQVLSKYQLQGTNIVYAYHHVNLDKPESAWMERMGLDANVNAPIVDGEWAQYASPRTYECYTNAPSNISTYFSLMQQNDIGMIFWSLEPGVGTVAEQPSYPVSDVIQSWFPENPSGYSQPDTFSGTYSCSYDSAGNLLGIGAGNEVMNYFKANSGE